MMQKNLCCGITKFATYCNRINRHRKYSSPCC